jgi:hypothetical protein
MTRLVRDGQGGFCYGRGGGIGHQLGPVGEDHPIRFREDKPGDLDRARAEVAAWREQNPHGTAGEMVAAIGHQFHRDYAVVLRAVLFAADRHQARAVTGTAAVSAVPRPGPS